MQKLRTFDLEAGGKKHYFFCPGCQSLHAFVTNREQSPCWSFDGNMEAPTFNPSLLVQGTIRCHLFLHNGKIEFCGDSEHDLKNKSVDMVDLPPWFKDLKKDPH